MNLDTVIRDYYEVFTILLQTDIVSTIRYYAWLLYESDDENRI